MVPYGMLETVGRNLDRRKNLEKMQKQIEETPFETIPHLLYLGLKDKSAFTDSEGNKYPEVTEENILEDYLNWNKPTQKGR